MSKRQQILARRAARLKAPGEKVPVVGNLCRVGGQFAPCDADAEGDAPAGGPPRTAKPIPDDPAQVQANVNATFEQVELGEDAFYSLIDAATTGGALDGEDELYAAGLAEPGPDGTPQLTDKGRALAEAAQAGDADTAKQIMAGEASAPAAEPAAPVAPAPAPAAPTGDLRARLARALSGAAPTRALAAVGKAAMRPGRKRLYWKAYAEARVKGLDPAAARAQARLTLRGQDTDRAWRGYEKAIARMGKAAGDFAVLKDARGDLRWLARSTTAFQDRDQEILAAEALDADSRRMTATKQFGPLRWWHTGRPEEGTPEAPWGPGLDLGDCDYSVVIGRTRYESGTFRDPRVGAAIAAKADQYELSPGFYHPYGPAGPSDGVYRDMATFERSLVPTRHARASNLFTGITVKEFRMNEQEIERRVKAFMADMAGLGVDPAATQATLQAGARAEKAADARGIAYKEQPAQPVYELPDGSLGIVQDGKIVALKVAGRGDLATKAPMPGAEMVDAGATELADGLAREGDEAAAAEGEERLLGDAEIAMIADAVVQRLMAELGGIQTAVAQMEETAKQYGFARKEQADLRGKVDQLGAELQAFTKAIKEFTDDLPASGYRPSQDGPDQQPLAAAQAQLKGATQPGPVSVLDQIAQSLPPQIGGAAMPWPFDVAPPAGVNTTQHAAPGAKP